MAYVALYRKYRPNRFDNILGQESVTKILKNQIKSGKISHAYLFSGTRGTGKTSAAKIFARAINCLNPKDGEPCNECEVCKSILSANTTDVIEMDAASNNSVENIRQIRQEVVYATVDVKYRVYIIDEVHMLTTSAFNALLKTLEEPPQNVVFILATTEQHKIPVTILSRCLRFDFNRISEENIIERLKYVLSEEKIQYEEEALKYIAKLADGAMRDALSILDRCISENQEILKYDTILNVVGAIDKNVIQNTVKNILDYDSIKANENVNIVMKKGRDLRQFAYELTEEFLNLLINNKSDENLKNRYIYIIDRLSKLDNELRQSIRPEVILKTCIVELCSLGIGISNLQNVNEPQGNINQDALLKKINNLENEIAILKDNIAVLQSGSVNTRKINKSNDLKVESVENIEKKINESVTENNISKENIKDTQTTDNIKYSVFTKTEEFKKQIIESGKITLYSALASTKLYETDAFIAIITNNSFAYNVLKTETNISYMKQLLNTAFGINKPIRVELNEQNVDEKVSIEKIFDENNIKYTNID